MGLYPRQLAEYAALSGIPRGPKSKWFFVDPVNGDDDDSGVSFTHPLATLAAAEDLTTGDQHDAVFFLGGDTQDNVAATIGWDKDYVHLIGMSADHPGIGQRCKIGALNADAVTPVITISGKGSIFRNIQVQNALQNTSGGVLVSGAYNYFENVYFNGMNHASSANKAGSYCLSVSGAENFFKNCTIGSVQTVMTSTNAPLVISNGANTWVGCRIQHYSETAGNFLVQLAAGTGGMSLLLFKDCVFFNQTVNWASGSTDVFNVVQTGSHYVLLDNCIMIGATGWADVVTHVYHNQAAPATGGGIAIAVNA
jgi:hypothetical protein